MKKIFLAMLLPFLVGLDTNAQEMPFSISEITRDLMIVDHGGSDMGFVWWLPGEYWELLFAEQNADGFDLTGHLLKALDTRIVFAVMKGQVTNTGSIQYKSPEDINANLIFTDAKGNRYYPQEPDKVDSRLQTLFAILKPAFVQMMGQYGANIHLVVFSLEENPENLPHPKDDGRFYIKFFDKDYSYLLPVGVFLPPKYCPADGEQFKGNWNYCPFHGYELTKEPQQ